MSRRRFWQRRLPAGHVHFIGTVGAKRGEPPFRISACGRRAPSTQWSPDWSAHAVICTECMDCCDEDPTFLEPS